jgi:hypothetical protein
MLGGANRAAAWHADGHSHITATAARTLSAEDRQRLGPEAEALARYYCEFPDENWAAFGEWGGGEADPRKPRFPDTRREWDISFYTGWNPVTREGRSYPHRPPESYEAVPLYFSHSVEALQAGSLVDAARYLGVALHYIQDSGAFGHLQPIHRSFHWKNHADVHPDGYQPQSLGKTPKDAVEGLRARLQGLVAFTEDRTGRLLETVGMPMAEVKPLCAKELMPPRAVAAVAQVRQTQPELWDAAVRECAMECAHVSADVLHTALSLAPKPMPEPKPHPLGVNLAANPSFEIPGDGVPQGWYVGWIDLQDRTGRAEWYRAGTHWDKPVKSGQRSLLVLWAPRDGIEWRQTWRCAQRVTPGERYRGEAWVKTRTDSGAAWAALEFSNAAYQPVQRFCTAKLTGDSGWKQLTIEAEVPGDARWLRLVLHADVAGAAWFDDVSVLKSPAAALQRASHRR